MGVRKHSVIMTSPVRRSEPAVLAVILVVALLLRLWGLGTGSPGRYAPQETPFVEYASRLLKGEFVPLSFQYPPLFSYLLAASLKVLSWSAELTGISAGLGHGGVELSLATFVANFVGRLLSCMFGVIGVFATYRAGRTAYGEVTGLIGAGLLAMNFAHARESHFATPVTLFTALAVFSVIETLKIADRGHRSNYAAFGLLSALACAANYCGVLLVLPFFLAHLSCSFRKGGSVSPTAQAQCLLITMATAAAVFSLLSPPLFLHWEHALPQLWLFVAPTYIAAPGVFSGWEWLGPFSLRYGAGVWLSALACSGFAFVLAEAAFVGRRKVAGLLLAAFPVGLGVGLLLSHAVTMRQVTPMMPFIGLLAIRVTWAVAERFLSKSLATALTVVLMFGSSFDPLVRTLEADRLYALPDTRTLAQRWIEAHVSKEIPIAVRQNFAFTNPEPLSGQRYIALDRLVALETLRAQHERFFIMVDSFPPLPHLSPTVPGWLQRFLAEHGEIVTVFEPLQPELAKTVGADGWAESIFDPAEALFVPVAGFTAVGRSGPRLTVYVVRGEAKE